MTIRKTTTTVLGVERCALETIEFSLQPTPTWLRVFACGSEEAMLAVAKLCEAQETGFVFSSPSASMKRAWNFSPSVQQIRPQPAVSMTMAYDAPPPPEDWEP